MEPWVRERVVSQIFSLVIFFAIAITIDFFISNPVTTPFGVMTVWGGIVIPLIAVGGFVLVPTLIKRTRSVFRDLVGAFAGALLTGVTLSIIYWDPTKNDPSVAPGGNVLGLMLSPLLAVIVTLIFGVSAGIIEYFLHRRARRLS